jgi:gliding motility-associated-like protein
MPRGKSINRVNRMQIFNRWGEVVYEKRNFMVNDASAGWDGTYKGKPAMPDVYIYLIEFVCENASIIPFRGNVTLIR